MFQSNSPFSFKASIEMLQMPHFNTMHRIWAEILPLYLQDITKPRKSETKHRNETPKHLRFFSVFFLINETRKKKIVFNIRERSGRDRGVFLIVNLHEVNSICLS